MHAIKFTTSALVAWYLALVAPQAAEAFWLTDGTLFLQQHDANRQQDASKPASSSLSSPQLNVSNGEGLLVANRLDPWVRLAEQPVQQTTTNQPGQVVSQAAVCQCNADWLQSQTSQWLNKWLGSASFAHQLQHSIARMSNTSARSLAWSPRPSNKRLATMAAKSKQTHQQPTVPAVATVLPQPIDGSGGINGGSSGGGGGSQQLASAHSQPIKVVQGEPGPKGERGPPGERGPSGLVSVKDRDALFDLPAAAHMEHRLAFVDAEQLLVVETSIGWRPVQMLAPLRDFRKSITKFSLVSPEQRLRLLASVPAGAKRFVVATGGRRLRPSLKTNSIADQVDGNDDDDHDDDDDEEEEDDEDGEQDDKFEAGDEEADEQDEGEDEDDEEEARQDGDEAVEVNTIRRSNLATRWPAVKTADGRGLQVSGRSAMAPPPPLPAGESNVIAQSGGEVAAGSPRRQTAGQTANGLMKLRLAALNEPFAGNQHGLRGANFECKRHAARANVRGAFRALLATNYQNLNEIVRYSAAHVQKYPIVNLRGETLASSWHELLRSPARMTNPLGRIYSFDGRHVASDTNWPNKLVWLGANNKLGHRDSAYNCDGWHSDSLNKFGLAAPLHSPRNHQRQQLATAGKQRHSALHRRGTDSAGRQQSAGANSSSPLAFDSIEKYPCRMPLVVLCIETVAQSGAE